MSTKAQIQKIAAKQNAAFEEKTNVFGEYEICIALPAGLVWTNREETGILIDYKKDDETAREFWTRVKYYINWPVAAERPRMPYELV